MRRGSYLPALAVMGALPLLCSPVSAQPYSQHRPGAYVDVGIFYDGLSPYGEWVEMPDYGWSWAPRVERGWRPYTRGQWVMTDDGWYWDSDERFGWATYHYGRWVNDPYYGWIWIPGTEWAPAWVSWRHGNGYTGWAPLPPRVSWRTHVGLSIGGLDIDAYIGATDYSFVRDRSFVDRGVYQRVLPPTQNVTIINVTNNVTNYTVVNERVVNRGIEVDNVERAVGRRVPRARTVDVDRADAPRRSRAGEVAVFRPEVREAARDRRPGRGRSLVQGDEPPALLAERRRERDQERRQKGNQAEVTAKDVQERKAPREDAKARQQDAQRERATTRQEAERQRAESQEQQRAAREQRQAIEKQQREEQKAPREDARTQRQEAQRAQQQEAQRERAAAREEAEKQRAAGQEQQRLERAQRQAEQPERTRQEKAPSEDARGQRAQQQEAQRAQQQEAQRERAAARQEAEKQRAEGQNQQRAEREQRQANEQQQRAEQQAERQRAKESQREANKEAAKEKGKKKTKPSPPPEG